MTTGEPPRSIRRGGCRGLARFAQRALIPRSDRRARRYSCTTGQYRPREQGLLATCQVSDVDGERQSRTPTALVLGHSAVMDEAPTHGRILTLITPRTIIHKTVKSSRQMSQATSVVPHARLPLCRRYLVVYLMRAPIEMRACGTGVSSEVRWISGTTAHAESEILGAWLSIESRPTSWGTELAELKRRGVERVQFAVNCDPLGISDDLRVQFPHPMALPSFADLIDQSASGVPARHRSAVRTCLQQILECKAGPQARAMLAEFQTSRCWARYPALLAGWCLVLERASGWLSLPPAVRRQVLVGDGETAALNRSLRKTVARHGCFEDADEALSFVVAALVRAERRLGTARIGIPTEHQNPCEGFQPRLAALSM